MEALARGGFLAGVLDLTTTELADDLVGGVLSAGPDRLEAAGELGLPQVVSLGALDMVNFGPRETVPPQFDGPQPLRPQPDDHADAHDARGVRGARAPDRAEAVRRDRADRALHPAEGRLDDRDRGRAVPRRRRPTRRSSRRCARAWPTNVELHELDLDVNDPAFADAMADRLARDGRGRRDQAPRRSRACARRSTPGGRSSAPAPAPASRPSAPRPAGRPDHHLQLAAATGWRAAARSPG